MENSVLLDNDMVRVLDILEQIKALNKIIDLHRKENDDNFMLNQYGDMKNRFLNELKELLLPYEIEVQIKKKAA